MKLTTRDIAQSAIDAAFAMLEQHGLKDEAHKLAGDLKSELAARQNTVQATLVTPKGDAGPLADSVREKLEKKLGHPVELVQRADSSLLGGAILEYGDMRIDMSLRGALDNARLQLEHSSAQ